ncbi:unnamed protein product [Rhodiola kirilowii]
MSGDLKKVSGSEKTDFRKQKVCFHCGKEGHSRRQCKERQNVSKKGSENSRFESGICSVSERSGKPGEVSNPSSSGVVGRGMCPWLIDSACSGHMTGKIEKFSSLRHHSGGSITFGNKSKCKVIGSGQVLLRGNCANRVYFVDPTFDPEEYLCLSSRSDESEMWHRRLGHVNFRLLKRLHNQNLVIGLPKVSEVPNQVCSACAKGKQTRSSFHSKNVVSTLKAFELVHMDLCGPMRVESREGNRYVFVIVDDYSRYTWVIFIRSKDEVFESFKTWVKLVERRFADKLKSIRTDHGTEISQHKYLSEVVSKYGFGGSRHMNTPSSPNESLTKDDASPKTDATRYRGMIGSLLYLTISKPDIMFSVCQCARFQAEPRESHVKAVKRILRYLKGTEKLVLWYPRVKSLRLEGFTDADFAGDRTDRKSTFGMAQFLGSCLVSWGSNKQNSMALSTAEAEYIAAAACCAQIVWLRNQLSDFNLLFDQVPIFCDNTSAISIAKNPVLHGKTKHIEIKHHFLRDCVEKELVTINFCRSEDQVADFFTKALHREAFEKLRMELGLMSPQ